MEKLVYRCLHTAVEELRQAINRELQQMGYHLRVRHLFPVGAMIGHDLVPPVDPWADELPEVMQLIESRIREFMKDHGYPATSD